LAEASEGRYIGSELELFAAAKNWKGYFKSKLDAYIHGDVAEVGAGIGSNTALLMNSRVSSWLCLEPDTAMAQMLENKRASGVLQRCTVKHGILRDTQQDEAFDTILYIDVLEHIEGDKDEVRVAASRLRPGGRLVVLSPAHQWLYTAFDKAIGHFRRYSISSLSRLGTAPLRLERAFYLDSVGVMASLANRFILGSSTPTAQQIRFWDGVLVSASKIADPMTFHRLGKTVVAVWIKQPQGSGAA
jgi:SAM-dependent methyltransferase